MEPSSRLWSSINRFLANHTFDLEWSPPGAEAIKFRTKFKMKLTGMKVYRQSSDKEYIQYAVYILPSGEPGGRNNSDLFFSEMKKLESIKDMIDSEMFLINLQVEYLNKYILNSEVSAYLVKRL